MIPDVVIVSRVAVSWNGNVPSSKWLDRRLALMRAVTIPSVTSAQDVTWVWLTCEQHRDRLLLETADLDFVRVVEQGSLTIPTRSERVVTIRIDSDDVLSPSLYADLRSRPPDRGELVEIMHGYQLDIRTRRMGRFTMRTRPPPIFAIGRTDDDALDVDRYHAWGRKAVKRTVLSAPGKFIQVVGHGNVLNKWRVSVDDELTPTEIRSVERQYGISLAAIEMAEKSISGTL